MDDYEGRQIPWRRQDGVVEDAKLIACNKTPGLDGTPWGTMVPAGGARF